jgi:uracil-DNA glycosylase
MAMSIPAQPAWLLMSMTELDIFLDEVRSCTRCAAHLPQGARPLVQFDPRAPILIAGQAPGARAHASGIPFDDASGDRLRAWLGVDRDTFYDPGYIALLPMGFCYPGSGPSGDRPPRPECAPAWRTAFMQRFQRLSLTIVLGSHAMNYHLGTGQLPLTRVVEAWRTYWPHAMPLPHPSPRNNRWLARNPWFAEEVLPALQDRVRAVLAAACAEARRGSPSAT